MQRIAELEQRKAEAIAAERYLDAARVKRELDPLKRRAADRVQEAAESRDGAAKAKGVADVTVSPQGAHREHRPQAPGGGDNSSAAVLETAVVALVRPATISRSHAVHRSSTSHHGGSSLPAPT